MSNISNNRDKKLALTKLAKLAIPIKQPQGQVYQLNTPTSDNMIDLVKEAPAIFIPYSTTRGLIIDYRDWHNVKFWEVEAEDRNQSSNIYKVKCKTWFHINRSNPRLKKKFLLESEGGETISEQVEIYKVELMFIGAMAHTEKALYHLIKLGKLDRSQINTEYFDKVYWEILNKRWKDSRNSGEHCVIKNSQSENWKKINDTNDMADIVMYIPIEGEKRELRLTGGPGLLVGYIPTEEHNKLHFNMANGSIMTEDHTQHGIILSFTDDPPIEQGREGLLVRRYDKNIKIMIPKYK